MNHDVGKGPLLGGCQCGAIRYALSVEPVALFVCHCRECQKQAASAFGISVIAPRADFSLTRGTPKFWSRPTDSGHTQECAFCPDCGTRLWHQRAGALDWVSIKGGSLDEPLDLRSAMHIWTSRTLAGVVIPEGAMRFEGEPPRE